MDTQAVAILTPEALPRCYVLDPEHHVVMECNATPGQELDAHYFAPSESPTRLPLVLDRAIEVLELNCVAGHMTSASATLGTYTLKVQLIGSFDQPRTSVIVDFANAA